MDPKAIVRPFYDQALTVVPGGDPAAVLGALLADDFRSEDAQQVKSKATLIGQVGFFWKLIPDLRWQIEDMLQDGDRVAVVRRRAGLRPALITRVHAGRGSPSPGRLPPKPHRHHHHRYTASPGESSSVKPLWSSVFSVTVREVGIIEVSAWSDSPASATDDRTRATSETQLPS